VDTMSTPLSFQLNPAPDNMHLPPSPPKRLKPEIYRSPDVFKNVDEHAIAVSFGFLGNTHDFIGHAWLCCPSMFMCLIKSCRSVNYSVLLLCRS